MARRRGPADPLNHCGLNVALYGRKRRWAMTERGRGTVQRGDAQLRIGPSALDWDGATLTIRIEEVTAPVPSRLRGVVRIRPAGINPRRFTLDAAGRHRWQPIAAVARAEVALESPGLRWSGPAYFDTNDGDSPLERDFVDWDWCRAPLREGAAILYNAQRRDGTRQSLALRVDGRGSVQEVAPPPPALLPRTRWGIVRPTGADAGHQPRVMRVLEDAPFYARSVIETHLLGEPALAVHESLSLDRFAALPVQMMLPFRIPRRWT
ncbi:carotenoid 1,2-hydratase [Belnapia rosea]|uniref:Hydroxyneurosporene synthase n=1 Tax=Belnapia rosea TaxID=938405 RepID=A0A1G6YFS8_9PROT|nr:carotenoid 1,2-hydratase [Belnapia rosea]SDD89172.1 hydroxyneurosporene synthase [Belnapia rosea]